MTSERPLLRKSPAARDPDRKYLRAHQSLTHHVGIFNGLQRFDYGEFLYRSVILPRLRTPAVSMSTYSRHRVPLECRYCHASYQACHKQNALFTKNTVSECRLTYVRTTTIASLIGRLCGSKSSSSSSCRSLPLQIAPSIQRLRRLPLRCEIFHPRQQHMLQQT